MLKRPCAGARVASDSFGVQHGRRLGGDAVSKQAGARRNQDDRNGGLRRAIGPGLLFFFILGDMLGGGIYALVGEVGAEVGGAIWITFLVAFVLALLTAAAYAELVTKYPQAAGAALYVNKAFKVPFVTFMVAFAVMASGVTSASALARGFAGDYFKQFVDAPSTLIALAFLAAITIVNIIGISESVKVNATFTVIEVGGLLLIILIGLLALFGGDADPGRSLEFKGDSNPILLVAAGATLAFYALIGFEDSVNVAEEVREPSRVYPRALFGAMAVAGVVYLLVTFIASMVVPTGQLAGSSAPLLEVVRVGPLGVPLRLFALIALFALANGALINMIMASRLLYGMANQGIVPRVFNRVLPGRRTPWIAIAFTTVLAVILIVTGDLSILADTTVMLLLAVFAIVNVSVLVLRRDDVEHEHFRAPTFAPVLGLIVSLILITQNEQGIWIRAGILLLIGLAFWVVNRLVHGPMDRDVEAEALSG
jgi:APA family basic amino acid/polyamine antiporter